MSVNANPAFLSAVELSRAYRDGSLSPVEVATAVFEQIERHDATLNAYCLLDRDRALAQARASERRYRDGNPLGSLDGVPVAIKDLFLTAGWPTLRGSTLIDPDQRWEVDAPPVAALRDAGAVFPGKTTTPELGWKGLTDSPLTGITRNPWDSASTPGGSSGGSAVAVAMGMAPLALGTDGGGSIRIPASFTGISGFKPTYGRVPHWPVSPYGTLAHAGPMARTVEDLALLLDAVARPDGRDWLALPPEPGVRYIEAVHELRSPLRIAFSPALGFAAVDPEVGESVGAAVRVFADMGAAVDETDPPIEDPIEAFQVLWNAGAAQATQQYSPAERAKLDPGLQEIVEDGWRYSAVRYADANTYRGNFAVTMNRFFADYDLLITPAMPIPAFEAGREVPGGWHAKRWTSWSPFSYPFNMTQQPAISIPCGFTAAGLPVGLQIVGRKYEDALVLAAAHAYQQAAPASLRWPHMTGE